MKIRSIETRYNGVYYRSRLEARWACLFDSIGIAHNYEVVGLSIGDDRYLPDFELPEFGWHVEIKPEHITRRDAVRLGRIFDAWGAVEDSTLAVIQGVPAAGRYSIRLSTDTLGLTWHLADCRRCGGIGYVADNGDAWGLVGVHSCGDCEREPDDAGDRIVAGYEKAMRMRFDHIAARMDAGEVA